MQTIANSKHEETDLNAESAKYYQKFSDPEKKKKSQRMITEAQTLSTDLNSLLCLAQQFPGAHTTILFHFFRLSSH